jgi:hypothetical protein
LCGEAEWRRPEAHHNQGMHIRRSCRCRPWPEGGGGGGKASWLPAPPTRFPGLTVPQARWAPPHGHPPLRLKQGALRACDTTPALAGDASCAYSVEFVPDWNQAGGSPPEITYSVECTLQDPAGNQVATACMGAFKVQDQTRPKCAAADAVTSPGSVCGAPLQDCLVRFWTFFGGRLWGRPASPPGSGLHRVVAAHTKAGGLPHMDGKINRTPPKCHNAPKCKWGFRDGVEVVHKKL